MPNDGLLLQLLINSGVPQYPDVRLHKAAQMLKPEERPTVPLVMVKDAWRRKQGAEAVYLPQKPEHAKEAGAPWDKPYIRVMQDGTAYKGAEKNPQRLAAVLAHEAVHSTQSEPVEAPAYAKQYEVLKRFGEKDGVLMQRLLEAEQRWRDMEQRHPPTPTVASKRNE